VNLLREKIEDDPTHPYAEESDDSLGDELPSSSRRQFSTSYKEDDYGFDSFALVLANSGVTTTGMDIVRDLVVSMFSLGMLEPRMLVLAADVRTVSEKGVYKIVDGSVPIVWTNSQGLNASKAEIAYEDGEDIGIDFDGEFEDVAPIEIDVVPDAATIDAIRSRAIGRVLRASVPAVYAEDYEAPRIIGRETPELADAWEFMGRATGGLIVPADDAEHRAAASRFADDSVSDGVEALVNTVLSDDGADARLRDALAEAAHAMQAREDICSIWEWAVMRDYGTHEYEGYPVTPFEIYGIGKAEDCKVSIADYSRALDEILEQGKAKDVGDLISMYAGGLTAGQITGEEA
jgi:hypothetical protein